MLSGHQEQQRRLHCRKHREAENKSCHVQADLWSLGIILYELVVGQPPFYTTSIYTLIHQIVKDPVKFPADISPDFKSFLQARSQHDP